MSAILFNIWLTCIIYFFLKNHFKKKNRELSNELKEKIKIADTLFLNLPKERIKSRKDYENILRYSNYMLHNFSDNDYKEYRDSLSESRKELIHSVVFSNMLSICAYIQQGTSLIERKVRDDDWLDVEDDKKEKVNEFLMQVDNETKHLNQFFAQFVKFF